MIYAYDATVLRIVDGDTIDLSVDCGFRIHNRDRFRLLGIDTPERGQAGWSEATAALQGMLPVGSPIRIVTDHPTTRDPRDKYGRWLATIHLPDGTDVNAWMIEQGYAVTYPRAA